MSSDLKWNCHVDYIIKKASKKLYSLRVLRRAGVEKDNILKVYLTTVRPVLEYAVPVWQAIPDYLSEAIEVVQKRSLKIIYPECDSYTDTVKRKGPFWPHGTVLAFQNASHFGPLWGRNRKQGPFWLHVGLFWLLFKSCFSPVKSQILSVFFCA